MIVSFCFSLDGKTPMDAKQQATQTGHPVLFFEGIFRYILFPGDDALYDYSTKEDVFNLEIKQLRHFIIEHYGIDPEKEVA